VSDNRRRFRAIRDGLRRLYPVEPKGNFARHLNTLAGLISGIVGSRRVNLPAIAAKVPDGTKKESRVKRFARWVNNDQVSTDLYFLPFAEALLHSLAERTLLLVMDGSDVGRECVTLMASVIYRHRALPVAWIVITGSKGHFSDEAHTRLLTEVEALVPDDSDVIVLGDGEFDGVAFQAAIADYEWHYVCRTAVNTQVGIDGEWMALRDIDVWPGKRIGVPDASFTAQGYGPVLAIAWWQTGCKEPIYLVTNLEVVDEACYWYSKRFRIETFFSDQKSRGFHVHKSHLSDPVRLARLMMAACLAYIWIVFLGAIAKRDGWVAVIHRTDRCDLSLFQLGLSLLEHLLNEHLPIPVAFQAPVRSKSVR
jgi:hypothetical protein